MNDIYRSREYEKMLNEGYFDKLDNRTRGVLMSIEEEDQTQVLTSLTHKLYDKVVAKADDIDYGSIPESKGDITKIQNFNDIKETLDLINKLVSSYRQPTTSVDIITEAIKNLEDRKDLFERCFRYGVEFGILMYNNIALAIVTSTSLLITTTIEFIKGPGEETFKIVLDRVSAAKSKKGLLFDTLDKFNHACKRGDVDKAIDHIIQNTTKNLAGALPVYGVVAGGIAVIGLVFCLVPLLRELIYYFYHFRVSVSDSLEYQSNLLKMNAYKLEADNERDPKEIKKIVKKQLKVSSTLEKFSDKLSIADKKATIETEKDMKKFEKEEKKLKIDQVIDPAKLSSADNSNIPESDNKASALF